MKTLWLVRVAHHGRPQEFFHGGSIILFRCHCKWTFTNALKVFSPNFQNARFPPTDAQVSEHPLIIERSVPFRKFLRFLFTNTTIYGSLITTFIWIHIVALSSNKLRIQVYVSSVATHENKAEPKWMCTVLFNRPRKKRRHRSLMNFLNNVRVGVWKLLDHHCACHPHFAIKFFGQWFFFLYAIAQSCIA